MAYIQGKKNQLNMLNILFKELITEQNEHIKKAAPTSQSDPAFPLHLPYSIHTIYRHQKSYH